MFKNKMFSIIAAVGLSLAVCMLYLIVTANAEAQQVKEGVLRFHIVANSNSREDQALKLKVRDGIVLLTDRLFATAETKEQAIQIAREHQTELAAEATKILRDNGSNQQVSVDIKKLYFPTKQYENVTFPAGEYDAIHISLGDGEGENFWCVMFPALCVPSVSEDNTTLLSGVMDEDAVGLVRRPYTVKFKTAEWLGRLCRLFS